MSSSVEPEHLPRGLHFATTHWSVVLAAAETDSPEAAAALERLCRDYWYPLYAHVRRLGWGPEDAQDLTQAFFARLLERHYLQLADQERGRFRTFLLTSLKRFLTDEWEKARAQKRGGGQPALSWDSVDPEERYRHEPADPLTPDRLYEKRWAGVLLEAVLGQLRGEYAKAGRKAEFEELKSFVWGEGNPDAYHEVAARLNTPENALKMAVHRLRKRFRDLLRLEVSRTVSMPGDVDAELRYLREVLSS